MLLPFLWIIFLLHKWPSHSFTAILGPLKQPLTLFRKFMRVPLKTSALSPLLYCLLRPCKNCKIFIAVLSQCVLPSYINRTGKHCFEQESHGVSPVHGPTSQPSSRWKQRCDFFWPFLLLLCLSVTRQMVGSGFRQNGLSTQCIHYKS